jgi:hypothetical protein
MKAKQSVLRFAIPIALAIGALAIAGCNDAQVTNVWQDRSFKGGIRGVMVVSRDRDPASRRIWEDALRSQIMKDGVEAHASYEWFPESAPSRSEMTAALTDQKLDAALILKPMPGALETSWVPGYTTTEPNIYYNPWANRQAVVYHDRRHPGYRVSEEYERQQVTMWTADGGGHMVWAGTVLIPAGSDQQVSNELATGVVPEMKKAGLI